VQQQWAAALHRLWQFAKRLAFHNAILQIWFCASKITISHFCAAFANLQFFGGTFLRVFTDRSVAYRTR
jgi:hypothetical protein